MLYQRSIQSGEKLCSASCVSLLLSPLCTLIMFHRRQVDHSICSLRVDTDLVALNQFTIRINVLMRILILIHIVQLFEIEIASGSCNN